ncbi:IS701 family transposase [Aquimarina sp. ERC-38]|uniref:IS701 family transposase n=1 Tax=Aquimarina sp. ERC-38 TaxID=2949996 RepID=UPI002AF6A884|nr:IS701 family transposase [Aquimarina sp. ERC-38]
MVSTKKNDSRNSEFLGFIESNLNSFFLNFSTHFKIVKFSYGQHAFDYFQSLFKLEKKTANCQNIADHLSCLDQQSINHFINSGHWSYEGLMDQVAMEASQLFAKGKQPTALLIDEVGFRKKGKMSACVSRQYLGCIGKTDNGQVAVAAGLSQGINYAPIDMRLFMPKEWDCDSLRRDKCNIPKDQKHCSKPEIAWQIIEQAKIKGVAFDYVNFDALYGNATFLLDYLIGARIDFIGDIRSDHLIYFNYDPNEKCRVDKYTANLLEDDFEHITIRESTKGTLKAKFHYAKVQILTRENKWLDLVLLVRKDTDGKTKYSLTNMENDHIKELAQKQGQRIFIEQIFKEGKNLVGMGDYQIRGWHGFHNHMAICMMAMLLIAKLKIETKDQKYTAPTLRKIVCLCIKTKIEKPQVAINIILKQHKRYINQLLRDQNKNYKT